ncbi:MAG: hypothetical protein AAF704_11830 [Cyanobacteria bacterium P01_D01_bin.123]
MENGFPNVFNLATLDGTNGFAIDGIDANDNLAATLGEAGDFNNDGFADLLIGVPFDGFLGGAYLVFGQGDGFGPLFNLADLTGENGLFLEGVSAFFFTFGINFAPIPNPTPSFSGIGLDGIGDFNNDGFDDVAIGAPGGGSTEIVIVYGGEQFPAELDLDDDLDGSNGFEIEEGENTSEVFGNSTSGIGDINGDGIDDVILGAPGIDDEPGEAYVFFGTEQTFPDNIESQEINGTNGFVIAGEIPGEEVGFSVSDAGDINGDGLDDLIVGARSKDFPAVPTRSYVVFGSRNGFPARLSLAALNGTNGFAIAGLSGTDEFGHIVSGIGDINGDGLDDVAIGAPTSDTNGTDSGSVYVVFGSQAGFPALLDAGSLNGNNGFAIDGLAAGDILGDIVSQAGDFNADGIADLLLGAPESDANGENSGQVYAIFGSQDGFPASFDLNTLDGSNGFIVNGLNAGDELGESVSGIGDFNGDGIDDIALGAPEATTNGNEESGQAYVIYGRRSIPVIEGDETDDVLTGTDESEIFEAGAGNDDIEAGGGDDTIVPGAGNDTVDGGAGNDTVRFEGNRSAFPIQIQGDSLRVGNGSDQLVNVETLAFDDVTVDVEDLKTQLVQVEVGAAIAITLPNPVDRETLNLYSDTSAHAEPDVVLTDSSGQVVSGSIVVSDMGKTLHFIPVEGPLPADEYELTLMSRADAFVSNGTRLDGDGNGEAGGDYRQTFTVEASAERAIAIPDAIFGPGQIVQTYDRDAETSTTGLPVVLNRGEGIERAEFEIGYDPALLDISGVATDSLPTGWSVVEERVDEVLGQVTATLAGPTLASGAIELARLTASVPDEATYGATGVITVARVELNDSGIAATGDAAMQVVSQLGDANGDENYTTEDALAIAQVAVGLGTGFAGQPLVHPSVIGDVTGDGTLSALDAAIVAAQAEGLNQPELFA